MSENQTTDEHIAPQPPLNGEAIESLIDSSDQFNMLNNPYDRLEYVHLTDRLIHRLEGGEEGPRPDFVVFLDKSARPVSWLTRELWDDLAREPGTAFEDKKVPERPQFLYLNIDSKHMFGRDDLPGLRSLFTVEEVASLEGIENKPTYFDDKHVLIVDEIGVSHATSVKAREYLQLAFPAAKVDTFTWMDQGPATNYGGAGALPTFDIDTMQFASPPNNNKNSRLPLTNNLRWYRDRSSLKHLTLEHKRRYDDGRGVIDRDAATPGELAALDTPRTRFGAKWLSVIPEKLLPQSKGLLEDVALLGKELRNGRLPYWPAVERSDYESRVQAHNGIDARSFTQFREWFKATWWGNYEDAPVIIGQKRPINPERIRQKGQEVVKFASRLGLFTPSSKKN